MKRKLELGDVKNYIDSNIKIYSKSESDDGIHPPSICSITQIGLYSKNMFCWSEEYGNVLVRIEDAQLILRPMSDLIKPMAHPDVNNREKFIPLIELSKVRYKFLNPENDINGVDFVLSYDETFKTHVQYNKGFCGGIYSESVFWCVTEINLLNKLHFDYNNLIAQGLAIDINQLKQMNNE